MLPANQTKAQPSLQQESNGASLQSVVALTREVKATASAKISEIHKITNSLRMLALNAMIEAARAGDQGRGFSVVANEVRGISTHVEGVAERLSEELAGKIDALEAMTQAMTQAMATEAAGQRYVDLALNAIEITDRNLYERTCDVRWWATDSAVIDALTQPNQEQLSFASSRLAVILSAYTVYLDLWLCDTEGKIVANGRPDRFRIQGRSIAHERWFAEAMGLATGDEFAVADVAENALLEGARVATYATAVRAGGASKGRPLGVLGIHFDWEPQAQAIVNGVRLSPEEAKVTRVMIVDARKRVIASSDGRGVLSETLALETGGRDEGYHVGRDGALIAWCRTPGYETYRGLGWYGVIESRSDAR